MRIKVIALLDQTVGLFFALLIAWHFALVLFLGASAPDAARGLVYEIGSVYVTAFAYYLRNALFFASLALWVLWALVSPRDNDTPKSEFKFSRYPLLTTAGVISFASLFVSLLLQFALEVTAHGSTLSEPARGVLAAANMIVYVGAGGCFLSFIAIIWRANRAGAQVNKDEPPSL